MLRFAENEDEKEPKKPEAKGVENVDQKGKKESGKEQSQIIQKTEEIKQTGIYEDLSSSEKQVIENLQNKLSQNPSDPSQQIIEMQQKLIGELDNKELKLKKMKQLIDTMNKIVFINENMDSDLKNVQQLRAELTTTAQKQNGINKTLHHISHRIDDSNTRQNDINTKFEEMETDNKGLRDMLRKAQSRLDRLEKLDSFSKQELKTPLDSAHENGDPCKLQTASHRCAADKMCGWCQPTKECLRGDKWGAWQRECTGWKQGSLGDLQVEAHKECVDMSCEECSKNNDMCALCEGSCVKSSVALKVLRTNSAATCKMGAEIVCGGKEKTSEEQEDTKREEIEKIETEMPSQTNDKAKEATATGITAANSNQESAAIKTEIGDDKTVVNQAEHTQPKQEPGETLANTNTDANIADNSKDVGVSEETTDTVDTAPMKENTANAQPEQTNADTDNKDTPKV